MKVSNFNFQCDLSPVIIWEYLAAPKLKGLINYQQEFMDTAITDFFAEIDEGFLNISTASTDGLALWGRLLNIGRPVYEQDGQMIEFSDEQYRIVLRAAIYLLAFDGSVKALNQFFKMLLPTLPMMITDNLNMTVSFNVLKEEDELEEWEKVLLNYLFTLNPTAQGISLPRPSGVKYILNYEVDYTKTFGFEGMTAMNKEGVEEQLPGFGSYDSSQYDPETSPGGTFYQ